MATIERDLFRLEEELINAVGPEGGKKLQALLAEDFMEIGASGRIHSKAQCVAELAQASGRRIVGLQDFRVRLLAGDVVLVTYLVDLQSEGESASLLSRRASLWVHDAAGWRIVFHQGTMVQ